MSTRRSFLGTLFGVLAALPLAAATCRLSDPLKVEAPHDPDVNPAYETATYEAIFFTHPMVTGGWKFEADAHAPRYNLVNGEFVRVNAA